MKKRGSSQAAGGGEQKRGKAVIRRVGFIRIKNRGCPPKKRTKQNPKNKRNVCWNAKNREKGNWQTRWRRVTNSKKSRSGKRGGGGGITKQTGDEVRAIAGKAFSNASRHFPDLETFPVCK